MPSDARRWGWWLALALLLWGCPRLVRLPEQANVGGLMAYDYGGLRICQQTSDRGSVHLRLNFGWQSPEESDFAAQALGVEGAFACGAGTYDAREYARRLEQAGARMHMERSQAGVCVVLDVMEEGFKDAWGLVALAIAEPRFEREAYLSLRERRAAERATEAYDRAQQAHDAAVRAAWPTLATPMPHAQPASAYEAVALGTAESTFGRMRNRCNLRVVVVTALDPNVFADLLLETIDGIPEGACQPWQEECPVPVMGQLEMEGATEGYEAVAGVIAAPGPRTADAVAMRLALLAVDRRLNERLVRTDKVARRVDVRYVEALGGYGLIELAGGNAFQSAEFALSELRKLRATGLTEEEVEVAKRISRFGTLVGYESMSGIAYHVDRWEGMGMPFMPGNEVGLMEACDHRRCNKVLQGCLGGISWGIVGDTSGIDRKSLFRL